MMVRPPELILYGVFQRLRARQVPLGIIDYLDAIKALRLGFGMPRARGDGRRELQDLCRQLWARSSEERRLIDRLFGEIPAASEGEIEEIERLLPQPALEFQSQVLDAQTKSSSRTGEPDIGSVLPDVPRVKVEFRSGGEAGDIPLPPAPILSSAFARRFVLQPQTVISERALVVLWRRFRSVMRSGPKTELNIEATIAERCRVGILVRAILRAPRVNRARLLVLADASPSMAPWWPFLETVLQSLALSRLEKAEMYYFNNLPGVSLFRRPNLTGAQRTDTILNSASNAGLLIISDGGAATGRSNPQRIRRTVEFLDRAVLVSRSLVWINPLPKRRWEGTTAGALALRGGITFLPLDVPSLIRAVDILRGAKTG
jgi:uncharacterized protein with von Willebrand factor type A (vWA) domain